MINSNSNKISYINNSSNRDSSNGSSSSSTFVPFSGKGHTLGSS